jgi:hypothetical protein
LEVTDMRLGEKRISLAATGFAILLVIALGFFVTLRVRAVVAGPDSAPAPAPPNPGHTYEQIELPVGTWLGLNADMVDGMHAGQTGANYILYADASGNVGIGTSSPDARLDIEDGDLDMSGNEIKNVGNIFWGVLSLDTGDFKTSDGSNGNVVIPGIGSTNCDPGNYACVRNFGDGKWAIQFEAPDIPMDESSFPGNWMCYGTSAGDNDVSYNDWGYGVTSTCTDANGHCYGSTMLRCATAYVLIDPSLSHDTYGVICQKVY